MTERKVLLSMDNLRKLCRVVSEAMHVATEGDCPFCAAAAILGVTDHEDWCCLYSLTQKDFEGPFVLTSRS